MARDGNGNYVAPSNSWNPAISGTQLNSDDWNSTQVDYELAITDSAYIDTDDVPAPPSPLAGQILVMHTDGNGRRIVNSNLTISDFPNSSDDITWTGNHTFNGAGTVTFSQNALFEVGNTFTVNGVSTFGGTADFNSVLSANLGIVVGGDLAQLTAGMTSTDGTFSGTLGVTGTTTLGTANITACNATDLTVTNVPTFSAGIGTLTELQVGAGAGAPSPGSVTIENDLTVGGTSSFKSVGSDDLTAANDITSTAGNITASSGTITGASFASQTATDVADSTTAVFPVPNTNGVVCVVRSDSAGSDEYYHGGYDAGGVDEVQITPNNAEYRGPTMGGNTGTNADVVPNMVVSISGANLVVANNSGTTADYRVTFF